MKGIKHIITALIILGAGTMVATAQPSTSPYSKLGFGSSTTTPLAFSDLWAAWVSQCRTDDKSTS